MTAPKPSSSSIPEVIDMRYKIMVNGAAYKARYANGSYLPDISKSGYAYLAVYYDNNLMATGEQITVDGTVYTVTYGVTVAVRGESGTSKVLSVTYNGVTSTVPVTFDGGTYNVTFTSRTKRRSLLLPIRMRILTFRTVQQARGHIQSRPTAHPKRARSVSRCRTPRSRSLSWASLAVWQR